MLRLRCLCLMTGLLWSTVATTSFSQEAIPYASIVASERYNAVDSLLQSEVEQKRIAGAVYSIHRDGKLEHEAAIGWSNVAAATPMTTKNLFRIASMTKPITSVGIMILVEEGKIGLDDPVSKYIPEFEEMTVSWTDPAGVVREEPAESPITVRQLLSHTSGLTYSFMGHELQASAYRQAGVVQGLAEAEITLEENAERLATCPLVSQPGAEWQYGMSTDMLGRVIEVASGMAFDQFLQQRVLEPLKMNDTFFVVPEEKLPRLATLYTPDEQQQITAFPAGPQEFDDLTVSATYQYPGLTSYLSGGAGLVSSTSDYARFLTMLLNRGELDGKRVLSSESVEEMTKNQIGDLSIAFTQHGDKFGLGFGLFTENSTERQGASPGSYTWGGIFNTYFVVDPEQKVVAVMMTQLIPFDHLSLMQRFHAAVFPAVE